MATKELRELRHKYKAAYTTYMQSVQALSEASERGQWPEPAIVETENGAFTDLAVARQELIEKLAEHAKASTHQAADS